VVHILNFKGSLNEKEIDFYIPLKLVKSTEEKPSVKHYFYGSDCCQEALNKEFKCSKCNKECLSVKVYPEGKPEETGSSDIWNITEIPFSQIDEPRIVNFKWLEIGKLRKPKASEVEKMREYKTAVSKLKSGSSLRELFAYLMVKRIALTGDFVFKEGKKNQFAIKPKLLENGMATLLFSVLDGNKKTIEPTEQYELPKKVEKMEEEEKKEEVEAE